MTPFRLIQFLIVALLLTYSIASAQKQSNMWYFGAYAALDFNQTPVKAINNSVMSTYEGSASIADVNGALLFYTDGSTVWNNKHLVMQNGSGLTGNSSSTQSGVIVPMPSSPNIYYVFTVGYQGGSLDYSIVDMNKDGGLGAITTKNVRLIQLSTEKITAVKHRNGRDIWVIGHELYNDKFFAWLITPAGISATPVISAVGSQHGVNFDNVAAIGYMKASPDGSKIALGAKNTNLFAETLDFDIQTGVLSNPQTLTGFNASTVYGIEFSADGKFLYVLEESGGGRLFQVKIPYTSGVVTQKAVTIASFLSWGGLQLCPDGRILVTQSGSNYLDAISLPSLEGAACGFVKRAVSLGNGVAYGGLPTFIQSYFNAFSFNVTSICIGTTSNFKLVSGEANYDQITWDFGEPLSGAANTSSTRDPQHRYQKPGDYEVNLTVRKGIHTNTITQTVTISPLPTVKLPADPTLFYGHTLTLDAGAPDLTYLWSNGSTSSKLTVTTPGTYSVVVTNGSGCTATDDIKVNYDQVITSGLPPNTLICRGSSITLDVALPGASYLWSDGSTGASLTVSAAGKYSVKITNAYNNRSRTDVIEIKYKEFATPILPLKTVLCEPGVATITATGAGNGHFYNWYDENKVLIEQNTGVFSTTFLSNSKTYYASVTDGSCSGDMLPTVVQIDRPYAKIFAADTVIKIGETITLNGEGGVGYLWEGEGALTSTTDQRFTAKPLNNTVYKLTTTNENGCVAEATINVIVLREFDIPNTFTPNSDGINDLWIIPNINYVINNIRIYNRYGEIVYTVNNYQNNWDGTTRGKQLPAGTYYYLIVAESKKNIAGSITIVR